MTTEDLSRNARSARALNPIVFTVFDDTDRNPRPGLGVEQLSDPQRPVAMIASLSTDIGLDDTVTLYWDDKVQQTFNVSQLVVDTGQLSFSVLPDQIEEPLGTVYYTVDDHSGSGPQRSPLRTVNVKKSIPGGPILEPDSPTNIGLPPPSLTPVPVDLDKRENLEVTVPNWRNIEIGDSWVVLLNGSPAASGNVTNPDTGVQSLSIFLRPDRIADARLPVTYEIRDEVGNYSRFSQTAWGELKRSSDIIPPVVEETDPQTLMLDLEALDGADAHVAIPNDRTVRTGDIFTLTWLGGYYNQNATPVVFNHTVTDSALDPVMRVAIPNADLQRFSGGKANVYYTKLSGTLNYPSKNTCVVLSGKWPGLPSPTVRQAVADVIDLGTVSDPVLQVTVPAYPGKGLTDYIRLFGIGNPVDPPAAHYLADHKVTEGEELESLVFEVSRAQLVPLINGQWRLCYQVTYNQSTASQTVTQSKFSLPATFSIIETEIVEDDFTGQGPGLIQAGASIDTENLVIRFVSGAGNAGFPDNDKLPESPGTLNLPVLHACFQNPTLNPGTQTLEVDLKREFKKVSCDIHGSNGATKVEVLDSSKTVIATINVPDQVNYAFSHSSATAVIRYLRIVADKDWTRWDNFVMEK
ncbi:hypothetical protein ACIPL1_09665 [Pseudomonas sp. NPDC090202]|uniref:hypothetical protein n=1 Tax=unclassified Pseudomonas TaxID=196821 RepID=UPI0038165EF6